MRVVTGYGPTSTSMPAPNDLYRYWRADRKTVILAANAFNGNVLEFYDDSQALKNIIPKSVFQEIRGRFGNKYFVDEEGVEAANFARAAVVDCLNRGGCAFVPGVSMQQREFSLVAVTSGGFLFGAASTGGVSAWSWVFASIWVPWVLMFGFYPLYVRQPDDLAPLWQNALVFFACVAATRAGVGVFGSERSVRRPRGARRRAAAAMDRGKPPEDADDDAGKTGRCSRQTSTIMDVTRLVSYIIDDSLPRFVAPRAHLLAPERSSRPTRARVTCTRDPTCSSPWESRGRVAIRPVRARRHDHRGVRRRQRRLRRGRRRRRRRRRLVVAVTVRIGEERGGHDENGRGVIFELVRELTLLRLRRQLGRRRRCNATSSATFAPRSGLSRLLACAAASTVCSASCES